MAFVFLVLVLNEMALVLEESNGLWDVAYEYDYEHRVAEHRVAEHRVAEHRVAEFEKSRFSNHRVPEESELGFINKIKAS